MSADKAIILLSGGIDSQTCLGIAKQQGYKCYAMAVDYGQKHKIEIKAAETIAKALAVSEFRIARVALGDMPGAALTDPNEPLPEFSATLSPNATYFPARNTVFLSLALAWAESINARKIFFGANLDDYHGFPDTRPEYLAAFTAMARLATKSSAAKPFDIAIETPLIQLDKASIIKKGLSLGLDYSLSITCYQATEQNPACYQCDSCVIRKKAFDSIGVLDPLFCK